MEKLWDNYYMAAPLQQRQPVVQSNRRAIQNSQESLRKLADHYGINPKTVDKWKKRDTACDSPMGVKQPRSTVLTIEEAAMIVAFRKYTLLPLDDCLYALQENIPHLTRSSLHLSTLPRKSRALCVWPSCR